MENQSKHAIVRIPDSDLAELRHLCEKRGMHQKMAVSRLIRWFAAQDDQIQNAILQYPVDASSRPLQLDLLRKLVGNVKSSHVKARKI